ncbi:hypothetical protein [Bilophila wadsworthia]|jgi:hypothetical protein|uniref:hypothetical protein n=1 Tax=Bilophila wadsworthia TaxID=35833 RepID=UPI0026DAB8CB|nr:hypothetical protein [Bilophila wadsworthia]
MTLEILLAEVIKGIGAACNNGSETNITYLNTMKTMPLAVKIVASGNLDTEDSKVEVKNYDVHIEILFHLSSKEQEKPFIPVRK